MREERKEEEASQTCHGEVKLKESQCWKSLSLSVSLALFLSLSLFPCLLSAAVQLNQQQGPHQSIIISLSPWIPPAPPPP